MIPYFYKGRLEIYKGYLNSKTLLTFLKFINQLKTEKKKAFFAVGNLVIFILLNLLGEFGIIPKIPIVALALTAVLLTVMSGCVKITEVFDAIHWRVILLIIGMLGFSLALERSGLTSIAASSLVQVFGTSHPILILAVIYLLSAILTDLISNNAVIALLIPVAISLAQQLGISPYPLVIATMFGSAASFSTPIGYQTNTLVYGAGGYLFRDFFKVGFPLALILWVTACLCIPRVWPFYP